MINKNQLQSFISKYYLSGLIESVKWEIKDSLLTVKFMSPTKEMLGVVKFLDFKHLPDSSFGINNTTQLNSLLKVTNDELGLSFISQNKTNTKIVIVDNNFTVEYTLADLMVIPKPGEYKGEEDDFLINVDLDESKISSLIKAHNALNENETVTLTTVENFIEGYKIEIKFGEKDEYSNKISIDIDKIKYNKEKYEEISFSYNSTLFKEILSCNKDQAVFSLNIGETGILQLSFGDGIMDSTYYLVPKDI